MVVKIDFEKAYDRPNLSFIRCTLEDMQLPMQLVDIIMECVTTCSLSILWNGEPTEKFAPTWGIHQGDPLSPYLFMACMEKLALIELEVSQNRWKPFPTSRRGKDFKPTIR